MKKNVLKLFFALGLMFFIGGCVLIFYFDKKYGIGFVVLGVMWAMIAFGQIKMLKRRISG
jgi:hypothetical protein